MADVLIRLVTGSRMRISEEACEKAIEDAGDGDPVFVSGGVPIPFILEEGDDVEGGKSFDQLSSEDQKKVEDLQDKRREYLANK